MTLTVHGDSPTSVFRLNGADENSASFALGWVMERCPIFRHIVVEAIAGEAIDVTNASIDLQKHDGDGGFTDVEIRVGSRFHGILEAKRSYGLPTVTQLARYRPRLSRSAAEVSRLVSVTKASSALALRRLPPVIGGVKVIHVSWKDLQRLARKAHSLSPSLEEKLWLRQLVQHLQEFVAMDRLADNRVYVVSLSTKPMVAGRKHTWVDVVEKDKCYFHPVGRGGFPSEPPNYIGFRYHGALQSVHHIEHFEIVESPAKFNKLWVTRSIDHFVYRLGPPMRPALPMRTGRRIPRAMRVWCAIDTLLSGAFVTVGAARDETQRRLAEAL